MCCIRSAIILMQIKMSHRLDKNPI
jgi:hypothetical protein